MPVDPIKPTSVGFTCSVWVVGGKRDQRIQWGEWVGGWVEGERIKALVGKNVGGGGRHFFVEKGGVRPQVKPELG